MAKTKTAPLDPKIADKLLDLLSTDNEFRRLFKKDPYAALTKVGYRAPKDAVAATHKGPPFTPPGPPPVAPPIHGCCRVKRIAPKTDVIKARGELKAMLTNGLSHTTPQLDAALADERRKLK